MVDCKAKEHLCICDCLPCKTDSCDNCNVGNYPPWKNGDMCHEDCEGFEQQHEMDKCEN